MSVMTLAPAVSTRRVRGRALTPDGKPALGLVEFISTLTQTDKPDNVTIVDGKITAPVNPSNGDWVITVPVTDDPDLTPGIKVYAVRIPGARSVRTITVPAATTDLRYVDALDSVIVPADMIGVALTGLTIGRVTTLAPGSLGTAELVGGAPAPELNLGIPQGPQGDRPTVELGTVTTGEPGSTAAITWSGVGSVASPYKLNFTIPRGDVGAQGPQPIVRTGTVTKIAPGGNPTADMTGTGTAASPYTLALGLVTGDKGDKGDKGDTGAPGSTDLASATGVLPVAKGGTGTTTAAGARTAIAAAPALMPVAVFSGSQAGGAGSDIQTVNWAVTADSVGAHGVARGGTNNAGIVLPAGVWLFNADGRHNANQSGRTFVVIYQGGLPGSGAPYAIVDVPPVGLGSSIAKIYVVKSGTLAIYPLFSRDTNSTFSWVVSVARLGNPA